MKPRARSRNASVDRGAAADAPRPAEDLIGSNRRRTRRPQVDERARPGIKPAIAGGGAISTRPGENVFQTGLAAGCVSRRGAVVIRPGRESAGLLVDVDHLSFSASHGVVANSCLSDAFGLATSAERLNGLNGGGSRVLEFRNRLWSNGNLLIQRS